jgi:hypothetical protein
MLPANYHLPIFYDKPDTPDAPLASQEPDNVQLELHQGRFFGGP